MAADRAAVYAAELVVTVGDCSALAEPVAAAYAGVPVVALAEVFAGAAA
ncbi:hypothetical protein [Micromonospora sp. WMMD980]|nr:hypothetical protein [Micromonospora sp. WMMD980]MDG4802733.1 hypothetical protein [Micromonospora sp. WMMD980]